MITAQPEAARRLNICAQCPHITFTNLPTKNTTVSRCSKCGCFLAAKARIQRAKCPLGKWHDTQNTHP